MAEVIVDEEKLAYGLERGIGHSDSLVGGLDPAERLRVPVCGLASAAIHQWCLQNDVPSQLVISQPRLPFDPMMKLHAMPLLGEGADQRLCDATYSQFFKYVGLDISYEKWANIRAFPEEKVLNFTFAQREGVLDWLTEVATLFQARNRHPKDDIDRDLGDGPLAAARPAIIRNAFAMIWDPDGLRRWTAISTTVEAGKTVAAHIPEGAIALA